MSGIDRYYSSSDRCYRLGLDRENVHQTIINNIGAGNLILDVGCWEGYLGKTLKDKGNTVHGIEISGQAAEKAKKVLDQIVVGNIEDDLFPWPGEKYDVIICADILEHLFDPGRVLEKIKQLLKPEGRIIISLPNIANYWIRKELLLGRFEYMNGGLLDRGHIRHFTYDTALALFKKSGFELVRATAKIELPAILNYPDKLLHFIAPMARRYWFKFFGYQFVFILRIT